MESAVTIVVPCYNEERRLQLASFKEFLDSTPAAKLLFVDDGSTDGTREMLEAFASATSRVEVLSLPQNQGKAAAVRLGLQRVLTKGSPVLGFWDADLATPLSEVANMLGTLSRRRDIEWILGSRVQLLGRSIRRRALRHYLGRVFATAASLVLRMPVYDTQCGAKLFRGTTELREVLRDPFLSRWIFDVEMLSRFSQLRAARQEPAAAQSIFELPLQSWQDVSGSKIRSGDFLRAIVDLFRIWRARSDVK